MSRSRRSLLIAITVVLAAALMQVAFTIADRSAIRAISDTAAQRLEVYRGSLLGEIRRYDYLSTVLTLNGDLVDLLKTSDARGADKVSAYLEVVARESKALDIYVMDLEGRTVAASNYRKHDSFVGMNFSFRPYFQDALATGHGHFYGVGTVSNEPGYYFASRVYDGERLVGVATVKVSLRSLDNSLQDPEEIAVAIDANGVIFLSSFPPILFKTLEPLSAAAIARLTSTRQYHTQRRFDAIGSIDRRMPFEGVDTVHFKPAATFRSVASNPLSSDYLVLDRPVEGTLWRLAMLTSLAPARAAARNAAMTTGFAFVALLLLGLFLWQRRKARAQRQRAKVELERAYNDLENQVELRTEALREANQNLQHEVQERMKTEAALKNTFEELVHSGKMAALGQMATSITHELNQPLAALQTLSDNAAVLLRRNRTEDAVFNLAEISQLVSRMGKITGELKSFARKTPLRTSPVDLCRIVDETVSLLRVRLRQEKISVTTAFQSPSVVAIADANRLEQVLVNLVNNAIDAMRPSAERLLTIEVGERDDRANITVRDTGTGLAAEAIDRLFEPFFTTKAAGQGLGLGLPISAEIVKEFGGTMNGRNTGHGAEFRIELQRVAHEEHV